MTCNALSFVAAAGYLLHSPDADPDMRGLHILVMWAAFLIAGGKS